MAGVMSPFTAAGRRHANKPPLRNLRTRKCDPCKTGDCHNCTAPQEAMRLIRSGEGPPLPSRPVCAHSCVDRPQKKAST